MEVEAKRRENAAWRVWWRDRNAGGSPMPSPPGSPRPPTSPCPGSPLPSKPPQLGSSGNSLEALPVRLHTPELRGQMDTPTTKVWRVATAAAKDGDSEEARRENLIWRTWQMHQGDGKETSGD